MYAKKIHEGTTMGKKTKVLIVDDEIRNVKILVEALSDDYELYTSSNGHEALELVETHSPNIILLDIMMPVMDGLEVCHKIRSESKYNDIKIIIVSAKASPSERVDGYAAGADDYLIKPFDTDEIIAKINLFKKIHGIDKADTCDDLTGFINRTSFCHCLESEIVLDREQEIAIIFLKLANLHKLNESIGHEVTDNLIRQISNKVNDLSLVTSRFSNSVFSFLLNEVKSVDYIIEQGKKIISLFDKPFFVDDSIEVFVKVNMGIAIYPHDGDSVEMLLRNADSAMYHAVEFDEDYKLYIPSLNVGAKQRLLMESNLRRAIKNDEFIVYYQPVIDFQTGLISSAEALVRWQTESGEMIFPSDFIPLAEETGLIVEIGEKVLFAACAQMKEWNETFGSNMSIAVNLSARQFQRPNLLGMIVSCLKETGLHENNLILEITESVAMNNADNTSHILENMKSLGISISIDDFGTGYSSLAYLKKFPIDTLKIDRYFVSNMHHGNDDIEIVAAIISMAHALKLKVVAEGIETLDQNNLLRELGCDKTQGYLMGRPMGAEALTTKLPQYLSL